MERDDVPDEEAELVGDPGEDEADAEAYERLVFDDDAYGSLCAALHGRRFWNSAEEAGR